MYLTAAYPCVRYSLPCFVPSSGRSLSISIHLFPPCQSNGESSNCDNPFLCKLLNITNHSMVVQWQVSWIAHKMRHLLQLTQQQYQCWRQWVQQSLLMNSVARPMLECAVATCHKMLWIVWQGEKPNVYQLHMCEWLTLFHFSIGGKGCPDLSNRVISCLYLHIIITHIYTCMHA